MNYRAIYIDIMDTQLSFGKHKGSSVEEVYEKDRSYCRWLRSQRMILEEPDSEIANFLRASSQMDPMTDRTY
jgi:hypothetical protein